MITVKQLLQLKNLKNYAKLKATKTKRFRLAAATKEKLNEYIILG